MSCITWPLISLVASSTIHKMYVLSPKHFRSIVTTSLNDDDLGRDVFFLGDFLLLSWQLWHSPQIFSISACVNPSWLDDCLIISVADPDPDPIGSETFGRIRIRKKSLWIRIRALRIRNEYEKKKIWQADKIHNFSIKCTKKNPLKTFKLGKTYYKSLYLVVIWKWAEICNLPHLQYTQRKLTHGFYFFAPFPEKILK